MAATAVAVTPNPRQQKAKLVEQLKSIPAELRFRGWVHSYLATDKKGKQQVRPCLPWATPDAREANLKSLDRVLERDNCCGLVQKYIAKDEGFTYIDIDKAINPETGETSIWSGAQAIIDALASYTETSRSGKGYHIVVRGTLPRDFHPADSLVEMYSGNSNKLLCMTGNLPDLCMDIKDRQAELEELLRRAEAGEFRKPWLPPAPAPAAPAPAAVEFLEEHEITEAEEQLPPFPRLPGALGQLVDGFTDDLAYEHKALCAVTYVGLEIASRFVFAAEKWLQPRFYSCLVGPAGSGKSAPDQEVRRALKEHGVLTSKVELSVDSGPALVEALAEDHRLILAPDELADQFEKCRAGATGKNSLFGELLRLFESNETANHTRKKRGGKEGGYVEVTDALFAIIGSATTERFERMWTGTGGVSSGLVSRFVLSYSEKMQPRIKKANDDAAIEEACNQLKNILRGDPAMQDFAPDVRKVGLSVEAISLIENWPVDLASENARRVLDMAKRFAFAMAVCCGKDQVDGEAMQLGLQFAEYEIAVRDKLLPLGDAANYVQQFENRILKHLDKYSPVSMPKMLNSMKPEKLLGGYVAFNHAFNALLKLGRVIVVGKSRKGEALYGVRRD